MGKQLSRMSAEQLRAYAARRAEIAHERAMAQGRAQFERQQAKRRNVWQVFYTVEPGIEGRTQVVAGTETQARERAQGELVATFLTPRVTIAQVLYFGCLDD